MCELISSNSRKCFLELPFSSGSSIIYCYLTSYVAFTFKLVVFYLFRIRQMLSKSSRHLGM